jgi:hypothetical protein
MIFLTADERPFKEGDYILSHDIQYLPTAPLTTYIVFKSKINEKDILDWIDIVSFRLVFVIDKIPKLSKTTKDRIIIDNSLLVGKESYNTAIQAMFKYNDRQYVYNLLKSTKTPIPLAVAWMKANTRFDAQKWRLLADVQYTLPDCYAWSIMAFCVKSKGRNPDWPKGSKKDDLYTPPLLCRESDIYTQTIIESSASIRNEIRDTIDVKEQNIITQRKETILQWL